MASSSTHQLAARVARRLPYLRRLPVLRLLVLGEVVMLAKEHFEKLSPGERRRLVVLLRDGRGRPANLSRRDRAELAELIAKADPRGFAGSAAGIVSPVPLPGRRNR